MIKIAVITGSTRPGSRSAQVAQWITEAASSLAGTTFEVVDIADYHLPLLAEPLTPVVARYAGSHTRAWAAKIDGFDGFIFITPECNRSMSAALMNAIDFLANEWFNKAAGFVSYGTDGGVRAVEHLRLIMSALSVATVRSQVALELSSDWRSTMEFTPRPVHSRAAAAMLAELVAWSGALKPLRSPEGA